MSEKKWEDVPGFIDLPEAAQVAVRAEYAPGDVARVEMTLGNVLGVALVRRIETIEVAFRVE